MTEVLDFSMIEIAGEETPPLSPFPGLVEMNLSVRCNTPGEKTKGNVLANHARNLPCVQIEPENELRAVLVGGGPSLDPAEIKWCQDNGGHVFALNGAAPFLNGHGIKPEFQFIIDPRPENVGLVGEAYNHIFASQCDPAVFDAVRFPYIVHMMSAENLVPGPFIYSSQTVGLTALCLAHTMGYRELHLYGYDSSYAEISAGSEAGFYDTLLVLTHHAYPQEQTEQESRILEVFKEDENGVMQKFTTNYAMAKQAEVFPKIAEALCDAGTKIYVHGSGLLPTIARSMNKPKSLAAE